MILTAILLFVLVLTLCLLQWAMPELIPLLENGSEEELEAYLSGGNAISGIACTALLQIIQVISIVLPGAPIQIAAGIVFGNLRAYLICHLSYVAVNVAIFVVYRRARRVLNQFLPMEQESKLQAMLEKSRSKGYMVAMACLLPAVPNGIIPYAAASAGVGGRAFLTGVFFGSMLPIFLMCRVGQKLMDGNYLLAAVFFLGSFAAVFLLSRYQQKILDAVDRIRRHDK